MPASDPQSESLNAFIRSHRVALTVFGILVVSGMVATSTKLERMEILGWIAGEALLLGIVVLTARYFRSR